MLRDWCNKDFQLQHDSSLQTEPELHQPTHCYTVCMATIGHSIGWSCSNQHRLRDHTSLRHCFLYSVQGAGEITAVSDDRWWQCAGGSSPLTSFLISHSRFRMQSSFLLRQRCAAMRFLLRRLMSWMNSSCSEVSLCIFTNIWKSFRGRFVIWSTGKGSFTWNRKKKARQVSFIH